MAVRIEVSEEIDRPVPVVFKFFADDHVHNHPRWDPYIELWRDSDEPMGVGTIIQRRNSRSGTPVEGTMEVVEYEPNRAFGVVTRDGPMEIHGRTTFEEAGEGRTRLTLAAEMPIDESMKDRMTGLVQRSVQNIKELIEAEENKAVVRRFNELVEQYWRTGDADAFDEVVASDFVHHAPGLPPDLEGMKQALPMFRGAFPDMRLTEEDVIAEGDKVVDRVTVRGTHEGELMGIPPSGNQVEFTETHISRIADGKIVERWGQWDALGMMQQISAVPEPGQGGS